MMLLLRLQQHGGRRCCRSCTACAPHRTRLFTSRDGLGPWPVAQRLCAIWSHCHGCSGCAVPRGWTAAAATASHATPAPTCQRPRPAPPPGARPPPRRTPGTAACTAAPGAPPPPRHRAAGSGRRTWRRQGNRVRRDGRLRFQQVSFWLWLIGRPPPSLSQDANGDCDLDCTCAPTTGSTAMRVSPGCPNTSCAPPVLCRSAKQAVGLLCE